jgi:hypothetical protein
MVGGVMSALGQKQTFAPQKVMSALPPKATAKADSRTRSCPLYPKSGHVRCTSASNKAPGIIRGFRHMMSGLH